MRILQIVQKPQRRGAEVFALQLSRELREAGHAVHIAYLYPHAGDQGLPLSEDDVVLRGREHHSFERVPGIDPALLWRLRHLVRNLRPDVIQLNGGRTVKYGAALAAAQRRRSFVLIYRNIGDPRRWIHGWRYALYSRVVMPRLDGVVGVSRTTLDAVMELYHLGVPTARIPCAVDPRTVVPTRSRAEVRRETGTPADVPVIVWVGSLTREKRPDRLLRAVAAIRRRVPDVHVWIIGDGSLRRDFESQVQASPLAACVRFLGVQDRVANYVSAGDVMALTSDTEGMPAVLLEAGLLGRPVVTTSVGGVAECVKDGETGLLVPRDDEDVLAEALTTLLLQPERRRRLGTAAAAWIERNFTMARVAPEYAAFYQKVLGR